MTRERPKQLSDLTEEPCLVLLGEPGLGKTYSVRSAARALEAEVDGQREIVKRLDLRSYDNADLHSRLFESEFWQAWLEGKSLQLFLDSFDETLPRDTSFHRLLIDELEEAGAAISRLRLRIVCRSAEWIPELGHDLQRLFVRAYPSSTAPVRQMVLAPLRRRDVAFAAECEGLDPNAFLDEIASLGLQSMAAVPLMLEMLLNSARESGRLPATRPDLFEDAVLRLVETYDREQRYGRAHVTLSAGERLAIAQRIAAAAIFSGKMRISTQPSRSAQGELQPGEISGRSEEDARAGRGSSFAVEERHILEVLRTALFVDTGPDRVRFRHRSFAEYLAASYLVRHELDPAQLTSLLVAPGEEEERLIPQLREVAAWMTTMDPAALELVLEWEPEVALRGDRIDLTPEQTDRIVTALLTPEVAETFVFGSPRLTYDLRAIDHPGLTGILRDELGDDDAPESVRQMAISIASACERRDLEQELLDIALDSKAQPLLRANATTALGELGSEKARRKLVRLAKDSIAEDEFRQVQGAALWVVFPELLDLEETFAILVEPEHATEKSPYVLFLREALPDQIDREDLPVALRWAAGIQPTRGTQDEFNRLVNTILHMAWPRLQEPQIADLTVSVIRKRLKWGVELFGPLYANPFERHFDEDRSDLLGHVDSRRMLIRGLVERIGEESKRKRPNLPAIEDLSAALVRFEDRDWILERYAEEARGRYKAEWKWLASPFLPEGEEFMAARKEAREQRAAAAAAAATALDEEIEHALARIEQGDLESWLRLIEAMRPDAPGEDEDGWSEEVRAKINQKEANLARLPGWKRADSQIRQRIVDAATAFLEGAAPDVENESNGGPKTRAGCSALCLLAKHPVCLGELSRDAWARWASIVFEFPLEAQSSEEDEFEERLFAAAGKAVPSELIRWLSRTADGTLASGGSLSFALRAVDHVRDPRVAATVLPKLEDKTLSPQAHVEVLRWVIDREPDRAVKMVEPYLTAEAIAASPQGRARAIGIASALLQLLPVVGWPLVKRFLDGDRELGIDALWAAAEGSSLDAAELPDPQLAELVATIFDLFPPNGSSPRGADEFEPLTDRNLGDEVRGDLLSVLVRRGADESVALVEELHRRYPEQVPSSLIPYAREARRARWNALDPKHVIELCHANTARLVFDDRGLQGAVLASLRRIQKSLRQGEPPLSGQLWNSETGKPEYENWISNWLAKWLESDLKTGGRVINREVQAATSISGKGRAKSVDIKVTAPIGNLNEEADSATVLIEVKGAWNSALKSAMESQLIEDYLLTSGHRYGIYVVLWFSADDWDRTDKRRRWDGGMGLQEAERFFAEQAEELSDSKGVSVRSFVLDCSQSATVGSS